MDDTERDLDLAALLAIDVGALLREGISDEAGGMRGPVQGTASAAAAAQMAADGLPIDMLGRVLTLLDRHTASAARAEADLVLEEPVRRGHTATATLLRAGIDACRDDRDYVLFRRWVADVYGLLALRAATGDGPPPV